jgi:hypothetical protein
MSLRSSPSLHSGASPVSEETLQYGDFTSTSTRSIPVPSTAIILAWCCGRFQVSHISAEDCLEPLTAGLLIWEQNLVDHVNYAIGLIR